tara:strand:- start:4439 stop:4636 length:198 start_codon:yes stop_codon:yes gene_type:complete
MQKFTHSDLLEITEQENDLKTFLKQKKEARMYSPKKETISNILNYSKALSVRKSKKLDFIEMILN